MKNKWVIYIFLLFFCGCSHSYKPNKLARISVSIYGAQGKKVYMITSSAANERSKKIDSAVINNVNDSVIFQVPMFSDQLYELQTEETLKTIFFIPETSYIRIQMNNITGSYKINGSAASSSLKKYTDSIFAFQNNLQKLKEKSDTLRKKGEEQKPVYKNLQQVIADSRRTLNQFAYLYADTVKNAGVFLRIYDDIDFGEKQNLQKQFIVKAAQRFIQSFRVQLLKEDVLATIDIYEKEYQVGDSLPSIILPDITGQMFSTVSLKGKYYLIDFWSTWCDSCFIYEEKKKQLHSIMPSNKFEIVSVAIDDNKYNWQNIVRSHQLNWINIIDEKMWKGTAVRTLKFDSIPFNFLVSPQKKILAKAIKADSLLPVIERIVN